MKLGSRFVLLLLAVLVVGCSNVDQIPVAMVEPAEIPIQGKSLTVAGFTAKSSKDRASAQDLAQAIENNIQKEGFIDTTDTRSHTKLSGLIRFSRKDVDYRKDYYENKKGERKYTYYYQVRQTLTVNYSLMNGRKRLASDALTFEYDRTYKSSDRSKAKSKVPSDEKVRSRLIRKAANHIARQFTPYSIEKEIAFLKGDDENLELVLEYVKRNRYDQAFKMYQSIFESSSDMIDRSVALHNQGKIKLIQGNHSEAFELISRANVMNPADEDILDSLIEVERMKGKADKVNAQLKR